MSETLAPEQQPDIKSNERSTKDKVLRRGKFIGIVAGLSATIIGTQVGVDRIKDAIEDEPKPKAPEVLAALNTKTEPTAIKLTKSVLHDAESAGGVVYTADPGTEGGFIVRVDYFGEKLGKYRSMVYLRRNEQGRLDPKTAYGYQIVAFPDIKGSYADRVLSIEKVTTYSADDPQEAVSEWQAQSYVYPSGSVNANAEPVSMKHSFLSIDEMNEGINSEPVKESFAVVDEVLQQVENTQKIAKMYKPYVFLYQGGTVRKT